MCGDGGRGACGKVSKMTLRSKVTWQGDSAEEGGKDVEVERERSVWRRVARRRMPSPEAKSRISKAEGRVLFRELRPCVSHVSRRVGSVLN
jgi:hypothetical protein